MKPASFIPEIDFPSEPALLEGRLRLAEVRDRIDPDEVRLIRTIMGNRSEGEGAIFCAEMDIVVRKIRRTTDGFGRSDAHALCEDLEPRADALGFVPRLGGDHIASAQIGLHS